MQKVLTIPISRYRGYKRYKPKPQIMKNLFRKKTPQATCDGDVISRSVVGGMLGAFCFRKGLNKKRQPTGEEDCLLGEESY